MTSMDGNFTRGNPWLVGLFIWTLVAIYFVVQTQIYLNFEAGGNFIVLRHKYDLIRSALWEFSGWYLWGLFSIPIYRLARKYPLQPGLWLRNFPVQLIAGFLFAFAHATIHLMILSLVDRFFPSSNFELTSAFVQNFRYRLLWRIMVYFAALAGSYMILLRKRVSEEQQRSSLLETQLAQAQLQALKMQLQPHFLFNTLQSISELMHQDIDTADEMMVRLAHFLRLTLDTSSGDVSLEKELEFLRCYLEIEELRFRDRMKVEMDIDPDTLGARVPNLILQPIVENAIKHGIALCEKGEIRIRTSRTDGMLRVEIQDNGPGLETEPIRQEGVGLANTRARLEQFYGKRQQMKLQSPPRGGVIVTLDLPFITTP